MSDVQGPPAELRFTLTVVRAATGATETYEMVGHVTQHIVQEPENGSDTLDGSAQRSD